MWEEKRALSPIFNMCNSVLPLYLREATFRCLQLHIWIISHLNPGEMMVFWLKDSCKIGWSFRVVSLPGSSCAVPAGHPDRSQWPLGEWQESCCFLRESMGLRPTSLAHSLTAPQPASRALGSRGEAAAARPRPRDGLLSGCSSDHVPGQPAGGGGGSYLELTQMSIRRGEREVAAKSK